MYWTNFTDKTASIERARIDGVRDSDKPLYIKERNKVQLEALVVDPDGEFLYFVEEKRQKFVRLSLKGIGILLYT